MSFIALLPVRIKSFRLLPVGWTVVKGVDGYLNGSSFGDSHSIDDRGLIAQTVGPKSWRVETERFLDDIVKVGHLLCSCVEARVLHVCTSVAIILWQLL